MANSKIISGYYSFSPSSGLQPENINGNILTHLIVGWASVLPATGQCIVSPETLAGFTRCTLLRTHFPHLKVMFVCGDGSNFSTVANNSTLIKVNFKISTHCPVL